MCYYNPIPTHVGNEGSKVMEKEATSTDNSVGVSSLPDECYCVQWIRKTYGIPIHGNANTLVPNVDRAYPGGVIILEYNGLWHAVYIIAILPNGNYYVHEANYHHCKTDDRVIEKNDPAIRGFIYLNPNA